MSNISTIHDAMIGRFATVLPSAIRMSDPHQFDENDTAILKYGFGVKLGPAVNSRRQFHPNVCIRRQVSIVLTRQEMSLDNNPSGRSDMELLLLEDQLLIMKDFEQNLVGSVAGLIKIDYESDNGIVLLQGDEDDFLSTEIVFQIEYFESLT